MSFKNPNKLKKNKNRVYKVTQQAPVINKTIKVKKPNKKS